MAKSGKSQTKGTEILIMNYGIKTDIIEVVENEEVIVGIEQKIMSFFLIVNKAL